MPRDLFQEIGKQPKDLFEHRTKTNIGKWQQPKEINISPETIQYFKDNPTLTGEGYDMDGYIKKYGIPDQSKGQHLTDEFKLPNHITFSTDSIYSNNKTPGGKWEQTSNGKWQYTPSDFVLSQRSAEALKNYFKNKEPDSILNIKEPTLPPKDLFEMAGISTLPEEPTESLLKSTAKGFAKGGATFMPKAFWGGVKVLKDVANQYPAFTPWAAGTQLIPEGYPEKQIAEVEKTAEYLTPEERKGWTKYIPKAAETLGQMAGSAVSTAGVGTLPAMAVGAGIDRTLRTQKEGESLPKSLLAGGMSTIAEYGTEVKPMQALTKIGVPFLKRLASGIFWDVPGEIIETFMEMKSIDEGLLGKKYTPQEYAKAILDTAATAAMTTGIATTAVQPFREMPPKRPFIPEAEEVALPPGEKPLIQTPPVVKPPEGFVIDKPIQPLPKPENVEMAKPPQKEDVLNIVKNFNNKAKEYGDNIGKFYNEVIVPIAEGRGTRGEQELAVNIMEEVEVNDKPIKETLNEYLNIRNYLKTKQEQKILEDVTYISPQEMYAQIKFYEKELKTISEKYKQPQLIQQYYAIRKISNAQEYLETLKNAITNFRDKGGYFIQPVQQPKGFTPIEAAPVVSKDIGKMTREEYSQHIQDSELPAKMFLTYEELHKPATHTMPSGEVMPGAEHRLQPAPPAEKEAFTSDESLINSYGEKELKVVIEGSYRPKLKELARKRLGEIAQPKGRKFRAIGLDETMEGTYESKPIHGNGNIILFTPLKIKPKSYRLSPTGDRIPIPERLNDLIDKKTSHYNVDDIVFIVQKADEAEGVSNIPLPHLKEDMAFAELYAGDKHTFISQKYYNYIKAHFPDATFKIADAEKAVQIYSNKKLVGLVMPLNLPTRTPTKSFTQQPKPKGEIVKEPTGTADAGGYVPTKEQTQYAGAERQAQELPEVVELYNEISKGKYPAVERYMKDKLGYFSPKKGKIGLRQDLPIGERIELTPHIEGFKNVLITVPDLSIRKGDIAIERDTIAVSPRVFKTVSQEFENYMRKESGLTDEEIAFRKDFNKKTRMYELRAYKRDKTLALKVLAHEAFHYIDYLPDQAKRGNVLGHIATLKKYLKHMLDTFPTSAEADINETKIELRKQSLREAKGQPEFWKAANQRYKELLAQELSTREVITKQEVMTELKALTQKVKPFDDKANPKFVAYRYSPKELYADAGGALLWNPKLLQETAPKFYKSFFAYLERKPEAKQVYDTIQNKLGMIPGLRRDVVIQDRIRRMKEGYERGRKARKEMEERRKTSAETIMDTILNQAVDDEHANLKRIRKLEKGNESNREIGRKARLSIEELKMIDSKVENYVNHFTKEVDAEMLKNNITLDDMGVLAQAARVIEERSKLDIFNPGGETLETSREMLSHLQQSWGREKFSKVAELFAKFQQLRQRFVMPALEEGKRYDPELIEYAKNNLFYTRFSVNKYLTERFGGQITGTIYKQYGTLSEIESPIEATIIQDIMLIRAAKVNELKLDMVEVLKQTNELIPAEIDKSTNKWQPKPPPDRNNYGVFTVMRDGKAEHYYVDKQIADSFQFEPYRAKQISAIVHMISEPFRRLFVTRNPRWMFKNPIRDIKSTIKQVPEIKLRNIPEFMLDYGRGVKEGISDVFLGKRSEDITKLMEKGGLITGRYYDQDNFETKIEELQSQFSLEHHPKKVEGAWNRLKRVYQIIDRQFDKAGRVSDISTKVAGYKYLKKHSIKSEREIMHDVRTVVGTPNSRRQGRLHWLSNNIFMFSNIGKEGLRSTWESYRTKPTAYLWKTTALNVLPLLTLLGAGAAGVEWVKKILEELSQYDLENKTIIPTPYTVNNKPVAIAIPEDYQGMVVRKLVFNIMNKDVGGSLKALWGAKPYQWHPMIKIGNAMFQYYILGNNPKDTFRNRDIIPRDRFEVGGLTASKALLKHTWNELGGSLFYRFPYDDVKEDFRSIETLKKTFPMNALGDFLIISNEGIKQSSYEIQDRLNQAYEKRRFEVKQEIKKSINSSDARKTDKEILKELYIPLTRKKLFDYKTTSPTEFINKYRRLESKKEDNPYLDSLENAHRNEVKEALLNEYSKKLSREELLQLLRTALKEKIVTKEFTRNYLIKRKAESSNR